MPKGTTSKETVETRVAVINFFMVKFPEVLGSTTYSDEPEMGFRLRYEVPSSGYINRHPYAMLDYIWPYTSPPRGSAGLDYRLKDEPTQCADNASC
jgi:hypothetical protein